MDVAFFKIDLQALESSPDVGVLLQLLATVNDINSQGYVGRLVSEQWASERARNEWTQDRFHESLVWQLFKSRVSLAADVLRSVVLDIHKAENSNTMPEIWSIINSNVLVKKHYMTLADYLPGPNKNDRSIGAGKFYNELTVHLFLRDKMSSHHDQKPLVQALRLANLKHSESNIPNDGWIQDGNYGEYTRALFVDQLQVIAWYQQNGIEPNFKGYDDLPRIKEISNHTATLFYAYVNFVHELLGAYLKKHELLRPADKPEWIKTD
jgi:methylglyoxal synthase